MSLQSQEGIANSTHGEHGSRPFKRTRKIAASSFEELSSDASPWRPPERVMDAIAENKVARARNRSGLLGTLKQALAHATALEPHQVIIGESVQSLLAAALDAFVAMGDRVVFGSPAPVQDAPVALPSGAFSTRVPLCSSFSCDLGGMLAAADGARMLVLSNPCELTGTFLDLASLRSFLACVPANAYVVIDETYREFATGEDADASLSLLAEFENLMMLRPSSGTLGLDGMRIGCCFASPQIVEAFDNCGVPAPSQGMAAAMLACLEPYTRTVLENRVHEVVALREHFEDRLDEGGIDYVASQANFVMLPCNAQRAAMIAAIDSIRACALASPAGVRISIGTEGEMARAAGALGLEW